MGTSKYISEKSLPQWLTEQAASSRVITPRREGHVVLPKPYTGGEIQLERTTQAPKEAALPACEVLLRYSRPKDQANPDQSTLELDDSFDVEKTLLFGFRPCDAAGFTAIDRTYLQGPVKDPYYEARRNALTIVTLACSQPDSTCFCHWVGGAPDSTNGSDALLTRVDGGYVMEALTPKGEDLLKAPVFEDAAPYLDEAAKNREAGHAALAEKHDISAVRPGLEAVFNDAEFWNQQAEKCISCGACTYMCPTCTCFNITDESRGLGGERLRTWDTCMASHFTRETSGHNPRTGKAARWRNRAGHKFWYYPSLFEGAPSCTGCGRCITGCPSGVDIRAIILAAAEHAGKKGAE